mgnify:CR=1 FL=1
MTMQPKSNKRMANNRFTFHESWLDTIETLPQEAQTDALKALLNYALRGIMPAEDDAVGKLIVGLLSATIDADRQRREGGSKGGRPKKTSQKPPKTIGYDIENLPKPMVSDSETSQNHRLQEQKPMVSEGFIEKEEAPSPPTPPTTQEEKAPEEKENYDYVVAKEREKPTSPTATEIIPMSEIEDVLLGEEIWVEAMCYKYNLPRDRLAVQLHTIKRGWIERGQDFKTLQDAKRHADSLLNIRRANGELAQPPAWNEFLYDLMAPHIAALGYNDEIFTAFGKHYMQDVGNGKPFFLGIPRFEEDIYERMKNFKETYKPPEYEQPMQSGSGSQSA